MNIRDSLPQVPFLADNLALNFINSEYGVGECSHDCFTDDLSVVNWLMMAGVWPDIAKGHIPCDLLNEARALRTSARMIVNAAMKNAPADLTHVNNILEAGRPTQVVEWDSAKQKFYIRTQCMDLQPASLLWPVVESLVNLITSDKFEFVRECEADDCILLFHDLSKSHRRRWCSMATCGNRMKVSAFRSRKKPYQRG